MECTAAAVKYHYPGAAHLKLWDGPGTGTVKHNARNYILDNYLYCYDCLVVVTSSRCTDVDMHLVNVATMYNIPVAVVRNKVDDALERHRADEGQEGDAKDDIETIRSIIEKDFSSEFSTMPPYKQILTSTDHFAADLPCCKCLLIFPAGTLPTMMSLGLKAAAVK